MNPITLTTVALIVATLASQKLAASLALSWAEGHTGKADDLQTVIFDGRRFLAAGNSPEFTTAIFSSQDGVTWQEEAYIFGGGVKSLAYGNGRYVLLDFFSNLLWSDNAKDWQRASQMRSSNCVLTPNLNRVTFGNGKFVAGGTASFCDSTSSGVIVISTNGMQWEPISTGIGSNLDLTYGGNLFIAVGDGRQNIRTSFDSLNWSSFGTQPVQRLSRVLFGAGLLIAFGEEQIVHLSTDAVHWNATQVDFFPSRIVGVAFGAGTFAAAGGQENTKGLVFLSRDGKSWTRGPLGDTKKFPLSGCFGNGRFVFVGQAGTTWSALAIPPSTPDSIIEVSVNRAVEITFASQVGAEYRVQSSVDLQTWADQGSPVVSSANQVSVFVRSDATARYFRAIKLSTN